VLLTAVTYVLLQELRHVLSRTPAADCQVETVRLRLIKIGGRIEASVRKIILHRSASHPWANDWTRAARLLGCLST
jgi:hypothetical protein